MHISSVCSSANICSNSSMQKQNKNLNFGAPEISIRRFSGFGDNVNVETVFHRQVNIKEQDVIKALAEWICPSKNKGAIQVINSEELEKLQMLNTYLATITDDALTSILPKNKSYSFMYNDRKMELHETSPGPAGEPYDCVEVSFDNIEEKE